jgi:hypothetical protein
MTRPLTPDQMRVAAQIAAEQGVTITIESGRGRRKARNHANLPGKPGPAPRRCVNGLRARRDQMPPRSTRPRRYSIPISVSSN